MPQLKFKIAPNDQRAKGHLNKQQTLTNQIKMKHQKESIASRPPTLGNGLIFAAALAASTLSFAQDTSSEEEVFELSPFTVDASSESGYRANQTLNGTRLKSELKDIGSALTIFTEELMDDLGANSIEDLINFAPNTDVYVDDVTDNAGFGNSFINSDVTYVSRGGSTNLVGQDFFQTGLPNDRFNTERLTFTRGPNSVLFGLGNAAGAFVSSTKRANLRRASTTLDRKSVV